MTDRITDPPNHPRRNRQLLSMTPPASPNAQDSLGPCVPANTPRLPPHLVARDGLLIQQVLVAELLLQEIGRLHQTMAESVEVGDDAKDRILFAGRGRTRLGAQVEAILGHRGDETTK